MTTSKLDPELLKEMDDLAFLMRERMLVGGYSVEATLQNAFEELPPKYQAEVKIILDAMHLTTHPKLSKQLDHRRLEKAVKRLSKYMGRVNVWRDRERKLLDIGVTVVANLILLIIVLTILLLWLDII